MLVRRFARTISVLAPKASIEHIYYDIELVEGGGTFMDGKTPEHVTASVRYFGPGGHEYEDDFELDVHLIGLSTTVKSKDSPDAQRRLIADSLEMIAKVVDKRLPRPPQREPGR